MCDFVLSQVCVCIWRSMKNLNCALCSLIDNFYEIFKGYNANNILNIVISQNIQAELSKLPTKYTNVCYRYNNKYTS